MAFKPRKPECGFLGCKEPHGPESYMCAEHEAMLAPVREKMQAEEDPYGTRSHGQRKTSAPQCTTVGCRNPRKPGESMCADCAEEAFWNDSAA